MGKWFKKNYKYTPLGWYTGALKRWGIWDKPDKWMHDYVDNTSDAAIIAQVLGGTIGGLGTTGTAGATGVGAWLNNVFGVNHTNSDVDTGEDDNDSPTSGSGGFFGKLFGKDTDISGIITGLTGITAAINAWVNQKHLNGAQKEQNEWNAEQASIAYDRQKEYYEEYLSAPAQVRQYQQAGLNPMMLAGGAAGATSPSVPQASTSSVSPLNLSEVLTSILNYKTNQRELDLREAELPSRIEANIANARRSNTWSDYHGLDVTSMAQQRLSSSSLALEQINTEKGKQALMEAQISETEARASLTLEQAFNQFISNQYADSYYANEVALQENELALKEAQAAGAWADVARIKADTAVKAEQVYLVQSQFLGQIQQNKNLAEQFRILTNEADIAAYQNDKKKMTYFFDRMTQTVDAVTDVVDTGIDAYSAVMTGGVSNTFTRTTNYDKNGKIKGYSTYEGRTSKGHR